MLAERGATVAVNDLDGAASQAAARLIGPDALAVPADVTDRDEMEAAVAAVVGRFGGLDVVVANAGVAPPSTTMRTIDPDVFERTLEIDLLGVWRTVRPALPQIVERQGHVVVVSSVYAWVNGMMNAPYAIAKSGVEAMGRALRAELSIHGASATVAHFGFINTQDGRRTHSRTSVIGTASRAALPEADAAAPAAPATRRRRSSTGSRSGRRASSCRRGGTPGSPLRGVLNPLLDRRDASRRDDAGRRSASVDAEERSTLRGGLDRTAGRD